MNHDGLIDVDKCQSQYESSLASERERGRHMRQRDGYFKSSGQIDNVWLTDSNKLMYLFRLFLAAMAVYSIYVVEIGASSQPRRTAPSNVDPTHIKDNFVSRPKLQNASPWKSVLSTPYPSSIVPQNSPTTEQAGKAASTRPPLTSEACPCPSWYQPLQ